MTTILRFFRSNAVAFLALFIALGGVGWAATSLPAGSVGARQMQESLDHAGEVQPVDDRRLGALLGADQRERKDHRVSAQGADRRLVPDSRRALRRAAWSGGESPSRRDASRSLPRRAIHASVSVSAVTVPGNGGLGTQVRLPCPLTPSCPSTSPLFVLDLDDSSGLATARVCQAPSAQDRGRAARRGADRGSRDRALSPEWCRGKRDGHSLQPIRQQRLWARCRRRWNRQRPDLPKSAVGGGGMEIWTIGKTVQRGQRTAWQANAPAGLMIVGASIPTCRSFPPA